MQIRFARNEENAPNEERAPGIGAAGQDHGVGLLEGLELPQLRITATESGDIVDFTDEFY